MGILVAVNNNGDAFMTPINEVLDALDLQDLDHFKIFPDDEQTSAATYAESEAMSACKIDSSNRQLKVMQSDVNVKDADYAKAKTDSCNDSTVPRWQNEHRVPCAVSFDNPTLQNELTTIKYIGAKIGEHYENGDLPSSNNNIKVLTPLKNTNEVHVAEPESTMSEIHHRIKILVNMLYMTDVKGRV